MSKRAAPGSVAIKGAGMMGGVGILNVGAGDTKLSFDKSNPAERIRAARIVKDMLRRGYALLVEVEVKGEKQYIRAHDFDEDVCEYIIADFDPVIAAWEDVKEPVGAKVQEEAAAAPVREPAAKPGGKRRVKAEESRAVAVGRTAGG